ncbi:MAG: hypothetical protein NTX63_04920 [Candidatus Peregrinibacteria bacterium]|nr:hypothetical protein [Candidatus Peregrinibacteria bacterium]
MSDDQTTPADGQTQPATTSTATSTGLPPIDPKILQDFGLTAEQIIEAETKHAVPASVREHFPDLVALLIKTESMNTEERDYWFQVLPIMNDDQIIKLRTILVNERDQLKKIDSEYNSEIGKINQGHKSEWNAFEAQEKKKILVEAEKKAEVEEVQTEESLLDKLNQVEDQPEAPPTEAP